MHKDTIWIIKKILGVNSKWYGLLLELFVFSLVVVLSLFISSANESKRRDVHRKEKMMSEIYDYFVVDEGLIWVSFTRCVADAGKNRIS